MFRKYRHSFSFELMNQLNCRLHRLVKRWNFAKWKTTNSVHHKFGPLQTRTIFYDRILRTGPTWERIDRLVIRLSKIEIQCTYVMHDTERNVYFLFPKFLLMCKKKRIATDKCQYNKAFHHHRTLLSPF